MNLRFLGAALVGLGLYLVSPVAIAAGYPDHPVTLVVPYPPGGPADTMARLLQQPLTESLGQQVVIENRAGAAGAIGSHDVAKASPDGYTLLFTNVGPSAVAPALQPNAGYDPVKDFAAVSLVSRSPLLLVVNPAVPANNLAELIKLAKDKPGTLIYSSAGAGSFGHLSTALFAEAAGLDMIHVPYKGQAPALTAVLSGEASMSLTAPSGAMNEYIKQGKLKLIGVSTLEPSPLAPGATPIATVVPNFDSAYWFGVTAPAKTRPEIIAKLNAAISAALVKPALQQKFVDTGNIAEGDTPDQFAALIASEAARWREVIAKNHVTLN
jgi:tripartite-type tricarboxylate transporter receptor subunit TctC